MHKSEDHPAYVPTLNKFKAQYHGVERPWTDHYWQTNFAFNYDEHPDIVEPIREEDWMWFRGDRVQVMTGEDKGKQSYICFVAQERNWVIVEGLNCEYDLKGKEEGYPGYMAKEEKPLLVTRDIKLVDHSDETIDYKTKKGYKDNKDKDTTADVVEEVTYKPKLATFEMDLMKIYNIKEDRTPRKTFWY